MALDCFCKFKEEVVLLWDPPKSVPVLFAWARQLHFGRHPPLILPHLSLMQLKEDNPAFAALNSKKEKANVIN